MWLRPTGAEGCRGSGLQSRANGSTWSISITTPPRCTASTDSDAATAFSEKQDIVKDLADVTSHQVPIDRTTLNSWEDARVTDWVEASCKKKLVMAGQWTEVCLATPALSPLAEGYDVYINTDASGDASGRRTTWPCSA